MRQQRSLVPVFYILLPCLFYVDSFPKVCSYSTSYHRDGDVLSSSIPRNTALDEFLLIDANCDAKYLVSDDSAFIRNSPCNGILR